MKLAEALKIVASQTANDAPQTSVFLACGFEPLHFKTFLAAHLSNCTRKHHFQVETGLYGDIIGNIKLIERGHYNSAVIPVEWMDLDPRTGYRRLGGWTADSISDIMVSLSQNVDRLLGAIKGLTKGIPTAISLPTLSTPPMGHLPRRQSGQLEAHMLSLVGHMANSLIKLPFVRLLNANSIDTISPQGERYDAAKDLAAGFPYTVSHASAMGSLLAELLYPAPTKKGLITDLDDTLWRGILGDKGVDGISWDLDSGGQLHGLYQQFVKRLTESGILVGVASKNDKELVEKAFSRKDIILKRNDIFPLEAHWQPKSESIARILKSWNIGEDSVVFMDDSPMEVAQVQTVFPEMECILFPKDDPAAVLALLNSLSNTFGKQALRKEDLLRAKSLKNEATIQEGLQGETTDIEDFLDSLKGKLTFSFAVTEDDGRPFELVNKTNQFNINGKRMTEAEWGRYLTDKDRFVMVVEYEDKFGPLGKIGVLLGHQKDQDIFIDTWVLSCRAFSRRIEYHTLACLFNRFNAENIHIDFQRTERNGPSADCFKAISGKEQQEGFSLSLSSFQKNCPKLPHGN